MGRINELRHISDADIRNYIPASKKSLLTLIEHMKEIMMKSKKSAQQYSSLIPEGRRPTAPHARPVHRSDATTKFPLMYTHFCGSATEIIALFAANTTLYYRILCGE